MGDAQNSIWVFLKNFSNKFSISDHVNGNSGTTTSSRSRKYYSYDRLETHDKGDFLSSSNPNLLDIVGGGKGIEKVVENEEDNQEIANKLKQPPQSTKNTQQNTPQGPKAPTLPFLERVGILGISGGGSGSRTKDTTPEGRGTLMAKKFTFSPRVTNYQEDNEHNKSDKNEEDSDDSNWIECGDDDEDGHGNGHEDDDGDSSTDFDDDENTNQCGYCGCEKKYTITKFVE